MADEQTTKVIVVLSAGRSGTSLLMNALGEMGMRLSENMNPARLENPEGFFEDAEIVEINRKLNHDLNFNPTLPPPAGWLESSATREAVNKLSHIITARVASSNVIWGFKDPRTSFFVPLWMQVFNIAKVVPIFVLAVRDPASVAASFRRQYNTKESFAELIWLQRNCGAIYHTAADCFIVHYEEWFNQPTELGRRLLNYTGLAEFSGATNPEDRLAELVKPNLNRAQFEDYSIQNQWVAKLYDQLRRCNGSNFDRTPLLDVVKECRSVMQQFIPWAYVSQQKELENELEKAVLENNKLLQQVKDLFEEVSYLQRQIKSVAPVTQILVQISKCWEILRRRIKSVTLVNGHADIKTKIAMNRSPFLQQRDGLILFAKRRVANLLPGVYRYYRGKVGRF